MSLPVLDHDGRSTIAAAEAQAALANGDTPRAREKYREAGRLLEAKIASARGSDKHLFRFVAATQYYHGGSYQEALKLCRRIELRHLPKEVRHLFPKFFQDVRERAAPDYVRRIRLELLGLWQRNQQARILERFQAHPYLLPPGKMAFLRATSCEKLGDIRAAVMFFADAVRLNPDDPGIVFSALALPLSLPRQGKVDEAWEYVTQLLESLPHPMTELVASLICFHRAVSTTHADERRRLIDEQCRHFENARTGFDGLSTAVQRFPESRELMALGFEALALALWQSGEFNRALAVWNCK